VSAPRIIEPYRVPARYRRPVRETEVTTVWNDGTFVKLNRFGETERRTTFPEKMDPMMQAFFEVLDGLPAKPQPATLALVNLDEGEISL